MNGERVDVFGPKGPVSTPGEEIPRWALAQLEVAAEILDNPGGGLVFATQTMGQVRATLAESDSGRWAEAVADLLRAEDDAVRRDFERCRERIGRARRLIGA